MSEIDWEKLNDLFYDDEIEWRVGMIGVKNSGEPWVTVLAYINARAVMERLDDACGQENWQDDYVPGPSGGVLCKLSIRIGDTWLTKCDVAENTDFEPVKGGVSDALKRALVKWSKGSRQLYKLTKNYGILCGRNHPKSIKFKGKDGQTYWCRPPVIEETGIVHFRENTEETLDSIIPHDLVYKQTSSSPTVIDEDAPPPGEPPEKSESISPKQVGLIWAKFKNVYQLTEKADGNTIHAIATEFCGLPVESFKGLN